jgi:hypothetical protein
MQFELPPQRLPNGDLPTICDQVFDHSLLRFFIGYDLHAVELGVQWNALLFMAVKLRSMKGRRSHKSIFAMEYRSLVSLTAKPPQSNEAESC